MIGGLRRQMFASLANRNFRIYAWGHTASATGTWMQTVAQSWLVLELTGSPSMVGFLIAAQTLPVTVVGPYAGTVADRVHKRRMVIIVQAVLGLQALTLGVLTVGELVTTWQVFLLAALLGLTQAFDNPVRQSFIIEMVGREHLRNAMGLNMVIVNVARTAGPAVAGIVIATGGLGICFLLNAASYMAVVVSMRRLDLTALAPHTPEARRRGQIMDGVRYALRDADIRVPLLMMAAIGCFVFQYPVVLPVFAARDLGGGADAYGFLTAAMGAGAIVGGLWAAARGGTGVRQLIVLLFGFSATLVVAALTPSLVTALVAIGLVGAWGTATITHAVATIQMIAEPQMRGRVMALWTVAFLGFTPIGGPVAGLVCSQFGGRGGLLLGAGTCVLVASIALLGSARRTVAVVESAGSTAVAAAEALTDPRQPS